MDAKLCSGDKCRDHSLRPTQAFNHDALLLLLTPQILYRVKSCYSYILRAERVLVMQNSAGGYFRALFDGVLPGALQGKHHARK